MLIITLQFPSQGFLFDFDAADFCALLYSSILGNVSSGIRIKDGVLMNLSTAECRLCALGSGVSRAVEVLSVTVGNDIKALKWICVVIILEQKVFTIVKKIQIELCPHSLVHLSELLLFKLDTYSLCW